ncbi:hypothetical protein AHAS_Ahas01G0304400 [Arachis hypogaea]
MSWWCAIPATNGSNEKLADIESRLAIIEKRTATFDGYLLQILDLAQRQHDRSGNIVMVPRPCMPPQQEDNTKRNTSSEVVPQSGNVTTVSAQTEVKSITQQRGSFTHLRPPSEKGKGIQQGPNAEGSLFDLFAPNSPCEEDDLVIDETKSTPRNITGASHLSQHMTTQQHWAVGLSKGTGQWHGRISQIPSSTYEKDISSLPAWSDFDSTTELCGLFTSTPTMSKPAKLPKLERIEMTCLGRPASSMTRDMQVLMQDSVTQSRPKRTVIRQAARGRGRGRRNNHVDPTEPRIPKTYEMVFRPFNNMGLSLQECKLAAYIFGKELPPEEILFKYSFFDLPRALFMSLAPPYTPSLDIINATCLMRSVQARKSMTPRAWFLPTNFATDVLLDTPVSELAKHYQPKWMHETNQLEHVYVPVWEAIDTCYMLLLDVKGASLYVLDVSRSPESIVRREANMRRICRVLGKIFSADRNIVNFRHTNPDPSNWGSLQYPGAIPNAVDSNETSTWLLYWLQQDGGFSTRIFAPIIHPEAVRMRTATSIASCDANEHGCFIDVKAELLWRDLMDRPE